MRKKKRFRVYIVETCTKNWQNVCMMNVSWVENWHFVHMIDLSCIENLDFVYMINWIYSCFADFTHEEFPILRQSRAPETVYFTPVEQLFCGLGLEAEHVVSELEEAGGCFEHKAHQLFEFADFALFGALPFV